MPKEVLYLKLEQNAELSGESVHISDLGKLYCKTQSVQNRCRTLPVFRFEEKDKGRRVVSALFVISLLQQDNPNLEVESIGAPETVVEQVKVSRYPGFWQVCKIVFVCCICFFGAAFTIMAFHNDIGIREVFGQIYELLTRSRSRLQRWKSRIRSGWHLAFWCFSTISVGGGLRPIRHRSKWKCVNMKRTSIRH